MGFLVHRRRVGRSAKDASLKLRDRYTALHLGTRQVQHSYAQLERELHQGELPLGGERKTGCGKWQPHAWSKRALGTRGLSDSPQGVPAPVRAAEKGYPGVQSRYSSVFWLAFWCAGDWAGRCRWPTWSLPPTLQDALASGDRVRGAAPELCYEEVLQVGKWAHLDALGWLLLHTLWFEHGQLARLAAELARGVFWQLVRDDPAFAQLHVPLRFLVQQRLPRVSLDPDPPPASRLERRLMKASGAQMRLYRQRAGYSDGWPREPKLRGRWHRPLPSATWSPAPP